MNPLPLLAALLLAFPISGFGLSSPIDRDINFTKGYDSKRAEAIRTVIRQERFQFLGGIVSYWDPDYGTRLSYTGDAASLNDFIASVRKLEGISMRVILYQGRDDEGRRDSAWQLDYSQARPDEVTIYLNLNAPGFAFDKVDMRWPTVPAVGGQTGEAKESPTSK